VDFVFACHNAGKLTNGNLNLRIARGTLGAASLVTETIAAAIKSQFYCEMLLWERDEHVDLDISIGRS
jgi:hypothetical protein